MRVEPAAEARLHLVGGKGGVGKTTCAAAIAAAAAAAGRRTLLLSTDPASSLADALRQPVSRTPRTIRGRARLRAVDVDGPHALSRWLAARRPVLAQIALRGTWLDEEDVSKLLRLSLPGIDEIAALLEIARHVASGQYDEVVVDTAPTGHTLRMLTMPATLRAMATVFDHMQAKHRAMAAALRGRWEPDAADVLIHELERDADRLTTLLRDPDRTRVSWVTLPEALAIEETFDALNAATAAAIPVSRIVVNRVTPAPPQPCRWCSGRRAFEAREISRLRRALPRMPVFAVSARDAEPRGLEALASIARELERRFEQRAVERRVGHVRANALVHVPAKTDPAVSALYGRAAGSPSGAASQINPPVVQLLMFGGKGGVGKTTCAAAAALSIARRHRKREVLLLSTDPAHSLGDALGEPLSDKSRTLAGAPPNLRVRELDAARAFGEVRVRYGQAIDAMFDRLSRGSRFEVAHDRQVMRDLIDLAPPGVDELAAILEVTDALVGADRHSFDLAIVDTAPSGHALRLLQMPALVRNWARAMMSILLKYQPVAGVGDLGPVLLRLSQGTARLQQLLADPERTRFVLVTRPATLPRAESVRLVAGLRALDIHASAVIINAAGAGSCTRCRRAIARQRAEVGRLRAALDRRQGVPIIIAAAETPPPTGPAALAEWANRWSEL